MHRLLKNHLDLDHSADFSTDLIRNSLQNIFKLIVGLVDMAGNSPDQFQTVEKGRNSLLNNFELTAGDVLELSLKRVQELNEVFSLGVLLLEGFLFGFETVEVEFGFLFDDIDDISNRFVL